MVALATWPDALEITTAEQTAIYALLRSWGPMTAEEVAATLRLDELSAEMYLANEAGTGNLGYCNDFYLTRD